MKVLILGSSGIVGQHMRLCVPVGVEPVWHRKQADRLHVGCDMSDREALWAFLEETSPEAIVNLAGENRTDRVNWQSRAVNVEAVRLLADWCNQSGTHLIQISSQAVFSGDAPPYGPDSPLGPVNEYGRQKVEAESAAKMADRWCILRLTFVLGLRPLPLVGRPNPVEQMLAGQPKQVYNRMFSPLFAHDAADLIWDTVVKGELGIHHLGLPLAISRSEVADALGCEHEPCLHEDFEGIEARPLNTKYGPDSRFRVGWHEGMSELMACAGRRNRAREIALFTGCTEREGRSRLSRGFGFLHQQVAESFRRANPQTDEALLRWYRETESYIWELSAYHDDSGFNYGGLCRGIAERLQEAGARRVLCLGDGIGDLTLSLHEAGFEAVYHDLAHSRTAAFAGFRFWIYSPDPVPQMLTDSWEPDLEGKYDAVVSLDFLEHVTDVPRWTEAIKRVLKPGGVFFAQNAFGIGSEKDGGSIPMHLTRNDRFAQEWVPLVQEAGFHDAGGNWWAA